MLCRKFSKKIWEYIEGSLPRSARRRFAGHVESCARCRRQLKLVSELRDLLKMKAADRPPEGYWTSFWPRLREKIHAPEAVSRRRFYRGLLTSRVRPAYSVALISALAVVILAVIVRHLPVPFPPLPSPRRVKLPARVRPTDFVLARAGRLPVGAGIGRDYICPRAEPPSGRGAARDFVLAKSACPEGNRPGSEAGLDRAGAAFCATRNFRHSAGPKCVFALGCIFPGSPRVFR